MHPPVVHLVGAGPGDADLLTLRAARLLQLADVIVHDRLVGDGVLELCNPLARRFDVIQRTQPRWLKWRQTWSHRVGCFLASDEIVADLRPMFLWRNRERDIAGIRLLDSVTAVGQWTTDPAVLALWQADFDAYLQRSSEGMPCTTLGL